MQLRTLRPLLPLLVLLVPVAAQAAPVSKKPPAAANASEGPKLVTAHLAATPAPQRAPAPSKSVGSPTDGHLIGGQHLATSPYLRIYPVYASNDVRWGTDTLVGLIDRAAKSVRKQYPDAVMSVGHLSKQGGGEIDRHASHESGRDADVGFYVKNASGKPIFADHMVPFVGDGTAPTWPGAHFDDARNWALVAALVGDGHAKVTHLFVATPIRERLLAYAAKIGAPPAIRTKAAEVVAQPRGSLPHDDHFHVRIACPGSSEKCIELPAPHHGHPMAVASSNGHPAHPSSAAPGHSPPAKSPPAATPPKAEASNRKDDDSVIPNLAPSVQGLDSAVIPAPLGGARSTWGTAKDKQPPISDPDGVLDGN